MISFSRAGAFRQPVIVIGPWALKFARNAQGRACNKYEAKLYQSANDHRRQMLCPVVWVSPWGFLLIMAATEPTTVHMSLEEYLEVCEEWGYLPGEDSCPFEPKPSDWGRCKGRRVALDYSTPAW